ncbi:MAG: glycosyltransferase family 2 protein [Chthoniobacterales bacterium]
MSNISIIIPTYNSAEYLSDTLESCLRQTLPATEIIVIDDGSTDDTKAVCKKYQNAVVYERVENGGVSRARNLGTQHATGSEYVFLDADDKLLPTALDDLSKTLADSKAGMAYGMVIERAEPPKHPRLNGFDFAEGSPPVPAQRNFWRGAVITPGSAIVRADLHKKIGGFVTGYEPLEDRDYWIKVGLLAPAAFCDSVVLDKTWRPSSHGSQHAKRIFRGQRAQRDLRAWCCEKNVDDSWIPTDPEILRRALDEALWRREFSILPALRREAAQAGLTHWKSALTSFFVRSAEPEWIHVTPRVEASA